MRIWLSSTALQNNIRNAMELSSSAVPSNFDDALTLALMGRASYEEVLARFSSPSDPLSTYLVAKHVLRNEKTPSAIEKMRSIKSIIRNKCSSGEMNELLCLRLRAFEHGYAFRRLLELYGRVDTLALANALVSYNHERHALRLLEGFSPATPGEALMELTVFRRALGLTAMRGSLIIGIEHLNYLDWLMMEGVGSGLIIQFNSIGRSYTASTVQVQTMESRLLLRSCSWAINDGDSVRAIINCRGGSLYFVGNPTHRVLELEVPSEGVMKTSTAELRVGGKVLIPPMDYASIMI